MVPIKNNPDQKTAIAVGNFDGYHLGHQKIVESLLQKSRQNGLLSIIVTFSPNPKIFFKKESRSIISEKEKKKILEKLPVHRIVILDFKEFYQMDGYHFIKEVLIDRYNLGHLVVGENFKFGKNRSDDIISLEVIAQKLGFEKTVVKSLSLNGVKISSSLIRKKILEGKVDEAKLMLGRFYYIDGIVTRGEGVGRELGFPTINIKTRDTILPEGVFKTRVRIGKEIYDSVTNIGCKPTLNPGFIGVETHIFGFDQIIYGKSVRIFFERKIRNEIRFLSKYDLVMQIKKDIESIAVDKGTHI